MGIKKSGRKRADIRKSRVKLQKKKSKTIKEEKLEIRLQKETKLYWIRATTGALTALVGRLIGLVSWNLFIWMLIWWFGATFFVSFVIFRYKYDKEEWNWKNIIKPGIGIFFFLFMIVTVFLFTLIQSS